jgi:hypothetical protein
VVHPDWVMALDSDADLTVETRRRLLGRAAAEKLPVAAAHMPAPVRVSRDGAGFKLEPFEPAP